MSELWTTLPSGAHATIHEAGIIVQKVSDGSRIAQAVLVTWDDLEKLVALKKRRDWSRLLHGARRDAAGVTVEGHDDGI